MYRPGQWGVRIENLAMNREAGSSEFGDFLKFETLTLCPIDTRCLEPSLLTADEREWFNAYHAQVRERLTTLGAEPSAMSPAEFTAFFERERKSWAAVVAKSGVKLELKIGRTSADTTAYVLTREVEFVFSNHLFSPDRDHLGWKVFGRRQMPAVREGTAAWTRAVAIAQIAHKGMWESEAGNAVFFHARYVNPGWSRTKTRLAQIDTHIFYR